MDANKRKFRDRPNCFTVQPASGVCVIEGMFPEFSHLNQAAELPGNLSDQSCELGGTPVFVNSHSVGCEPMEPLPPLLVAPLAHVISKATSADGMPLVAAFRPWAECAQWQTIEAFGADFRLDKRVNRG